jgi:ribosomal protein L21
MHYLSPAIISIAPLKFPMFQHSLATLNKQDNMAFWSSYVGRVSIRCVVHELTYKRKIMFTKNKANVNTDTGHHQNAKIGDKGRK